MNIQEIYDWAKSNNMLDSEIYVDDKNGIIPLIEVFISKRNGKKNHCYGRSRIMKYKVGDKVKIREDLEDGQLYGNEVFVGNMMACRGRIAIIDDIICDNRYYIDIDQEYCVWTDEMFEDYTETTAMTVKDLLNKTDVEKGGLIITVYYPNAYFEATIGHNKINRNSELYKRFIKAYGDMIVDEISFDIRSENMVVMLIKVDYTD